ncbi:MAG: 30S ribosomal protein S21 [Thermodesulfovibrionales bacterium]|nr:30S ribosomal protein S21 [Thermodesulfovibrionales bacterium]
MIEIRVVDNDIEKAIKVLKRKIQTEGLLKEIKTRSYYEKPSVKEKRKRAEARRKRAKAQKFRRF